MQNTIGERGLNEIERSILLRELDRGQVRKELWGTRRVRFLWILLAISLLFEVVFVTQFEAMHLSYTLLGYVLAVGAGMAFCTGAVSMFLLWVHWRWRRQETKRTLDFHQRRRLQIGAVLQQERVHAFRFEAVRGVFFLAFEDEGDVFVFENLHGQCLLISGQCVFPLYPPQDPWPGRVFELVESADGTEFLGIFGDGQKLDVAVRSRDEVCGDPAIGTVMELKSRPFDVRLADSPLEACLSRMGRERRERGRI